MGFPSDIKLPADARYFTFVERSKKFNSNYDITWSFEYSLPAENIPSPAEMDVESLNSRIDVLSERIEQLEQQISAEMGDTSDLEVQLENFKSEYDTACDDPRVECSTDSASGSSLGEASESTDFMTIVAIVGALIVVLLAGGLFMMRSGRVEENVGGFNWEDTTLPARDNVANSMYGGTQQMFQQQMPNAQAGYVSTAYQQPHYPQPAVVQPPAPTIPSAGPPLPPGGLPSGWSMDQWTYYGQQYLDRMNNQ